VLNSRVITCAILALVLIVLDPDPKTIDLQAILPYLVSGGSAAGTAFVWKMINAAPNKSDGGGKKSKRIWSRHRKTTRRWRPRVTT
jgi:hypothetical protein